MYHFKDQCKHSWNGMIFVMVVWFVFAQAGRSEALFVPLAEGSFNSGIDVSSNDHNTSVQRIRPSVVSYSPFAQTEWDLVTVVKGVSFWDSSLAIAPSGDPHIVFSDQTTPSTTLKHAFVNANNTWQVEVVDNTSEAGWYNSIAIDSSGGLHISYQANRGYANECLRYAYFDGVNWHITSLEAFAGSSTSIAVDAEHHPHIIYVTRYNEVKYARYDGSTWITETISSGGLWFGGTSIALTASGKAHATFSNMDLPRGLFWATNVSGVWKVNYVDDGRQSSLKLDSSGNPHIAYNCEAQGIIKYAYYTGSNWAIQPILFSSQGDYPDIALDSKSSPHIAFSHGSTIEYDHLNGENWIYEAIDDGGDPSIVLDSSGNPHFSYIHYVNDYQYEIRYAQKVTPRIPVPTVTEWGLAIMSILLGLSASYLAGKKRIV
jgi:hypothetical protein